MVWISQNKVPVCTLFLRGACTREGCKYRHVKVSETAGICEAFVKGYCAKGAACQLKHELPSKKRKQIHPTTAVSEKKKDQPSSSTGTFASAASAARTTSAASVGASASATTPVLPKPKDDDGGLSIRPNIRFASKHGAGFPSLFEGLHSQRPAANNDQQIAEPGVRMEQLPLRVQREIWSALASGSRRDVSPRDGGTADLARAFLRVASRNRQHADDSVCLSLAKLVLSASAAHGKADWAEKDADQTAHVAFQREMRRLTLHRVDFPSRHDADDDFALSGMLSSSERVVSRSLKRARLATTQSHRLDRSADDAELDVNAQSPAQSPSATVPRDPPPLTKEVSTSVISRVLLQTALRFGSRYAGTLVDSLLLPLLVRGGDADTGSVVGPAQAEAISRVLRSPDTVSVDQLDGFIQRSLVLAASNSEDGTDDRHLLSNESALLVYQSILNAKPTLSPATVERFVSACETALERPEGRQLCSSLKFATVIFTLISKYPQQCVGHLEALEAIATKLTSLMAKTTLRSLQKLKTSS
ncbi:hypothetical protein BBJ28_00005966 [Nothophytophthora sp. Chile5]|nr:hypothetical protein BBJ28_00005966 [Nothophytophthora sp. Chile5]